MHEHHEINIFDEFCDISCIQIEFGISALLLPPVFCTILAFCQALQSENMILSPRVQKVGSVANLEY